MAKQMIKGMMMMLTVVALSLVTAVVASGQSSRYQVTDIPFDFTIGNQDMPAGRYDVSQMNSGGEAVRIRQRKGTLSAIRLSNPIVHTTPSDRGKLVFHRYGNTYFLAEVWSAGSSTGRRVVKSNSEEAARRELAANQKKYERVEIAFARQ